MDMGNHPVAAYLADEFPVPACNILPDNVPDPEPGWATRNPDRALAFLFVSPRPCSAIDELMRL
jgi:hypothetical protein